MGYAQDQGYIPVSIEDLMSYVMANINTQFTLSYTAETFAGTGFYKFFYAAVQEMQRNEVKTSEIFAKLQDYFDDTNEKILRPKVTPNGIIDALLDAGYTASVKPIENADAGKAYICVDVDDTDPDYDEIKLEICTLIKDFVVAGVVSQGDQVENITLTNGQEFAFRYSLPDRTEVLLRLTLTLSRNNQSTILSNDDVKLALMANIAARYALGKDFEPETYFTVADAPWCSDILLEYSVDDGGNWLTAVYESDFDELFEISLENISIIEG